MLTNAKPKISKFYFPGMISLVLLPLACVVCLAISSHFFQQYGVLSFNTAATPYFTQLEGSGIDKQVYIKTGRNYTPIIFTGDKTRDADEQKRVETLVGQLVFKKDTINGIGVEFGPHSTYASMVSVVDLCQQNLHDDIEYSFYDNRCYIRYVKIELANIVIDNLLWRPDYKPEMPIFSIQNIKNIGDLLLRFWPSVIILLIMIGLTVSKKRYYILSKPTVSANN